jgi:hypothetical protein
MSLWSFDDQSFLLLYSNTFNKVDSNLTDSSKIGEVIEYRNCTNR